MGMCSNEGCLGFVTRPMKVNQHCGLQMAVDVPRSSTLVVGVDWKDST